MASEFVLGSCALATAAVSTNGATKVRMNNLSGTKDEVTIMFSRFYFFKLSVIPNPNRTASCPVNGESFHYGMNRRWTKHPVDAAYSPQRESLELARIILSP